jgi:release factor glutamine methyltransferase
LPEIHRHVARARHRLRDAGIPPNEADLDARLLAETALGWTAERYLADADQPEPAGFADRYHRLVDRRAAREPIAYILGRREFWNLSFEITSEVLIPRPETELIVEAALELFPDRDRSMRAVDVCTGSGCIAVALAHERPAARVIAVDISTGAVEVARRNAVRHAVEARVDVRSGNLLADLDGPFDLIVANPPYVRDRDRLGLQPEVREHEPAVALFAGADGFDVIRRLLAQAPPRLGPGGYLVFEFGFGQEESIEALIAETAEVQLLELRRDLQGLARTAVARRE